ncbi:hypothetical protein LCGC14_0632090 [marine sediment metagenome]|uniref:Uncharacterized protein n=1 Tax=marine sediment metagenome TaxID=412755 RepID=A0A0F9R6V2_9ZZZZ
MQPAQVAPKRAPTNSLFVPIYPTGITDGHYTTWTDIDVTDLVPDEAVAVILNVANQHNGVRKYGLRRNRSTDNRFYNMSGAEQCYAIVALENKDRLYNTAIKTNGTAYNGTQVGAGGRRNAYYNHCTVYETNPQTGSAWTWDEIDALQAGCCVEKTNVATPLVTKVWVEVDHTIAATGLREILILRPNAAGDECNIPGEVGEACPNHYLNVDEAISDEAATVVMHLGEAPLARDLYGMTDHAAETGTINRVTVYNRVLDGDIGVFEFKNLQATGTPAYVQLQLVGWIKGITMSPDGVDLHGGVATGSWQTRDCSVEAPGAIALIINVVSSNVDYRAFGLRKNGSSDNRTNNGYYNNCHTAIIGCDDNQVIEMYREDGAIQFWLTGYITSGVTMLTNAIDISLSSSGSFIDLAKLTEPGNFAFMEYISSGAKLAVRRPPDGSHQYRNSLHMWAFCGADPAGIVQAKEENVSLSSLFLVGYSRNIAVT